MACSQLLFLPKMFAKDKSEIAHDYYDWKLRFVHDSMESWCNFLQLDWRNREIHVWTILCQSNPSIILTSGVFLKPPDLGF